MAPGRIFSGSCTIATIFPCLTLMLCVLKIAVPVPMHRIFDYLPPAGINHSSVRPGVRVEVPFGRSRKTGILLEITDASDIAPERLRAASRIIDTTPLLSEADLRLMEWASHYYHHPIGEAMSAALAAVLRKGESAAPETRRRLFATPTPNPDAVAGLRRAPRQLELFTRLQQCLDGMGTEVLSGLAIDFSAPVRALISKGLAEWRELPPSPPTPTPANQPSSPLLTLNSGQAQAIATVTAALGSYQAFLLEGVTGSGKTEVYLRLTQAVLARGQQVMILLPEINLTPQLEARFRSRFDAPIATFHSALADGVRRRTWLSMQRGEAAILLGTRSAVFTPIHSLGLIILDEEHDSSFKQQEGFHFSARDVAVMRARFAEVPILLGSATPSLESLHNVQLGRYQLLDLPYRAGNAAQPRFQVLDIRAQRLNEGISAQLAGQIRETVDRGEQALLFVNRRGYAPTLICHDCGWVAPCRHCDTHLVIHAQERRLRCHHCGLEQPIPPACPDCGKTALQPLGLGTERVEAGLNELFPQARVARIDRDSTRRKGSLERVLKEIHAGQINILIGTQMLAKGHHFPGVTLVGILDVDAGLYSNDFRAGERTAQLIIQVAGRAGREEKPGTVMLQTRHPAHPLLLALVRNGYPDFARACLLERQETGLPPFSHQALWRADALDSRMAQQLLETVAGQARRLSQKAVDVLGPVPAPLARRGNRYRWQLLLQSGKRGSLHTLLDRLIPAAFETELGRKVRWAVDVDPVDLF